MKVSFKNYLDKNIRSSWKTALTVLCTSSLIKISPLLDFKFALLPGMRQFGTNFVL